jgi:hypothetical protein
MWPGSNRQKQGGWDTSQKNVLKARNSINPILNVVQYGGQKQAL